jgi:hypothetical protein
MRCRTEDADTAGGVFADRQDVHAHSGQGHRLDEVRGQQRLGLGVEERRPVRGGPVGGGVDAGLAQDLPDRGGGDLDAEGAQFAVDTVVPPGVVLPG